MKAIRSSFKGSTRRIRVEGITWNDTSWPNRGRLVQFGIGDENGPVLIELTKRQAAKLARHLLEGVIG